MGAFNIQVFGQTKASHPEIMDVLARVAREFDVLLVEEVRDADQEVADRFLEAINRTANPPYSMVEGPRLGRTNSKEQYVIYHRAPVTFVDSFTVPDPDDRFEREPLVPPFQAGASTSGWISRRRSRSSRTRWKRRGRAGASMWERAPISRRSRPRSATTSGCWMGWCGINSETTSS